MCVFVSVSPISLSPPRLSSVSVFRVDEPTAVSRLMEWSVRLLQWERSSFVKWGIWRITRRRVESLMSRPASRKHCIVRNWLRLSQPGVEEEKKVRKRRLQRKGKNQSEMRRKVRGLRATLSLPGGVTRSLIWESLTPSAYRRSRERRRGQPEEQRAETDDQEQPASIKSFRPAKSKHRLSRVNHKHSLFKIQSPCWILLQ